MSNTTPPPAPDFPPPLPPEAPAPKKNHTNAIIIGAAAAIVATIITTGIVVVQSTNDDSKPATTAASSVPDEDVAAPAAEESEQTYAALTPADFTMELRTTERQCFGSAGCNITVEPTLSYVGAWNGVDPDAVYSITYEIRGDESGPVIETAELSDETSLNYTPSLISAASASTKVSVEITDVTVQGY
ncbi:hypothetical protein [Streptomyces sp. NBC_00620]|uniref:hypothetical protein n=1 Tax=Streptomyces sp. NBC_00620 TaxID=2903666 RepID=UPI0022590300|nr:hypothetical protein [Streptomyces sp. NBC_00620]MCX4973156.1 hypothetical protein [Streptomyces sp. NBC_00620]